MKIAFISDIHGNAVALEAVLEDIKTREVEKIFVLGDICYRGPEPQRSVDLIKALNTDVIKGNADEWVVRGVMPGEVPNPALEMMNNEREWTCSQLDDDRVKYLKSLPFEIKYEINDRKIHAFHATPTSLFEVVQPHESDEILSEKLLNSDADIVVYGHIHKSYIRYVHGKCVINTGSVGLPFDGLNQASYVILNGNGESFDASIIKVKYDFLKVIDQFRNSSYPNKELLTGIVRNGQLP